MQTPSALVHASVKMLPRLMAEESFLAATRVAVGTGSLREDDARGVTSEWTRLTQRAKPVCVKQPSVADLAAIGIGIVEVPRV